MRRRNNHLGFQYFFLFRINIDKCELLTMSEMRTKDTARGRNRDSHKLFSMDYFISVNLLLLHFMILKLGF